MVTRRSFVSTGVAAATLAALPLAAQADVAVARPAKSLGPVTLVVPFVEGGSTDIVARLIASPFSKALGRPVHVKNMPGNGGAEGSIAVAKAEPDGQTLIMGQMGTHALLHSAVHGMHFHAVNDFTPIGLVSVSPMAFLVRSDLPVDSMEELKSYLRHNQPGAKIAHGGMRSTSHLGCLKLKTAFGAPYAQEMIFPSTHEALRAVVSGDADVICDQLVSALPYIHSGALRPIGTATVSRNMKLPEIHAGIQKGNDDLLVSGWNAVFAPKDLAADIQGKLAVALQEVLSDEETRETLQSHMLHVPFVEQMGPKALHEFQAKEIAELRAYMPWRGLGLV